MRKPRNWTKEEYAEIVRRKRAGDSWKVIALAMRDTKMNVVAAYRRAVGAKHSAYKNKTLGDEPIPKNAQNAGISFFGNTPRVAVVDIETLPMVIYAWGLWDKYNAIEQVIQDGCILSWAGKWLNESTVYSDVLTPEEAILRDTHRIVKSLRDFLAEADVVIGHNYAQFDQRIINTEFLKANLPPLKYVVVDTFQVARLNFRFGSNKMKFINEQLGLKQKMDNDGFPLWKACSEGDASSLQTMLEYNCEDIGATEDLFYKVRPYVRNLNVALYNELDAQQCPVCGATDLRKEGYYYTPAGKWDSLRCGNCGCVARGKTNLFDKYKKKSLVVNS